MKQFALTISGSNFDKNETRINVSRLALKTGYSPSHLSRVFRGETSPSLKCLTAVGDAIGLDMSDVDSLIKQRKSELKEQRNK